MKKLQLFLAFLLAAGVAFAQQSPPPPPSDTPLAQQPSLGTEKAGSTKQVSAEVVSIDVPGRMITVTKEGGVTGAYQMTTLPVDTGAVGALKTLVPGEKVKLVCKTDSSGKETAVQSIVRDKSSKTSPSTRP